MAYKKCETFDGKQTNWCGLWYHHEYGGFSSQAINLSELKKFKGTVRLYVRKNKFYNNGENGRPNYNFCIKDSESDTFVNLDVNDEYSEEEKLYTKEEVQKILNRCACAIGGDLAYGQYLVSDFDYD